MNTIIQKIKFQDVALFSCDMFEIHSTFPFKLYVLGFYGRIDPLHMYSMMYLSDNTLIISVSLLIVGNYK